LEVVKKKFGFENTLFLALTLLNIPTLFLKFDLNVLQILFWNFLCIALKLQIKFNIYLDEQLILGKKSLFNFIQVLRLLKMVFFSEGRKYFFWNIYRNTLELRFLQKLTFFFCNEAILPEDYTNLVRSRQFFCLQSNKKTLAEKSKVQSDLITCGLFICEFAYVRLRLILSYT
jgi:hypothetical protein